MSKPTNTIQHRVIFFEKIIIKKSVFIGKHTTRNLDLVYFLANILFLRYQHSIWLKANRPSGEICRAYLPFSETEPFAKQTFQLLTILLDSCYVKVVYFQKNYSQNFTLISFNKLILLKQTLFET